MKKLAYIVQQVLVLGVFLSSFLVGGVGFLVLTAIVWLIPYAGLLPLAGAPLFIFAGGFLILWAIHLHVNVHYPSKTTRGLIGKLNKLADS